MRLHGTTLRPMVAECQVEGQQPMEETVAKAGFFIGLSTWLKIGAGVIGFVAASAWFYSAHGPTESAAQWNGYAATITAIAVFFQATTAFIDRKYPPFASFA